jgi:hypothetical protein
VCVFLSSCVVFSLLLNFLVVIDEFVWVRVLLGWLSAV